MKLRVLSSGILIGVMIVSLVQNLVADPVSSEPVASRQKETPKKENKPLPVAKTRIGRFFTKISKKLKDKTKNIAHKIGIKKFDAELDMPFELGEKAMLAAEKGVDKALSLADDESLWPWVGGGVGAALGGTIGVVAGAAVTAAITTPTVGLGAPVGAAVGTAIAALGTGVGTAVGPAVAIAIGRTARLARNKLFTEQTKAQEQLSQNKKLAMQGESASSNSDRPLDRIVFTLKGNFVKGDTSYSNITDVVKKMVSEERLVVEDESAKGKIFGDDRNQDLLIVYQSDKSLYFRIASSSEAINLPSLLDKPFYYSTGIFPGMDILGAFFIKTDGMETDLIDMASVVRQMFDAQKLQLNLTIKERTASKSGALIIFFQVNKKIYVQIADNKSNILISPTNLDKAFLIIDLDTNPMPIDKDIVKQVAQDVQSVIPQSTSTMQGAAPAVVPAAIPTGQ